MNDDEVAKAGARRFTLPPRMCSVEEAQAIVVGLRWVLERGSPDESEAARSALRQFLRGVPTIIRHEIEDASLLAEPEERLAAGDADIATIRKAIAEQSKLRLLYTDADDAISRRIICPLMLGYFRTSRALLAYCELRADFRHFRTDRIRSVEPAAGSFSADALLARWKRLNPDDEFNPAASPLPPS